MAEQDYITLKWGTLKSWSVTSDEGKALLEKYGELGYSMSAAMQHDTPEQKEIIMLRFLSNTHDPKDRDARMYEAWRNHLAWLEGKVIGDPQATEAYTQRNGLGWRLCPTRLAHRRGGVCRLTGGS